MEGIPTGVGLTQAREQYRSQHFCRPWQSLSVLHVSLPQGRRAISKNAGQLPSLSFREHKKNYSQLELHGMSLGAYYTLAAGS
jgi:hypothetical protein